MHCLDRWNLLFLLRLHFLQDDGRNIVRLEKVVHPVFEPDNIADCYREEIRYVLRQAHRYFRE
jgi:hypothetical protein